MKQALKLLVTLGLLWAVFKVVDVRRVGETLLHADPALLLAAVLRQPVSTFTAAVRWSQVMAGLDFDEPLPFYLQSYFTGAFFNQALPGSIGGTAVKPFEDSRRGYTKTETFYGIALDRIVGIVVLLVLNLTATLASPDFFPTWLVRLILLLSGGGLVAFSGLTLLRRTTLLRRVPGIGLFYGFSERLKRLYHRRRIACGHLVLSVVVHLCSVLAIFFLARAIGLSYPPLLFMVAIPPVLLLSIVPISLAGWGVREGAMVGIFLLIGAAKAAILSVSILYGVLLIFTSLPGLFFWLRSPDRISKGL